MTIVQIPNGVMAIKADYRPQTIGEYRNNPLIEALPPILSKEEVVDRLVSYPLIRPDERELAPHLRIHAVQRIFRFFQPLPVHLELEQRLSRMLRQSYVDRNPFFPRYAQGFHEGWEQMEQGFPTSLNTMKTALGLSIIGISGIGKTTAIDRILQLTPQVICHSSYQGQTLSQYQVTWMKLECPFDGSIKGLALQFMAEVDRLLGTRYFDKYGRGSRHSTNVLLPIIGQIARSISLGMLIVDELQHLSVAKSGGAEKMLNFFVTLVNVVGIPVVLVGTPKAMKVLQAEFRQARRGSGQGDMVWDRMQEDEVWQLFMEALWSFQWTKSVVPLEDQLSHALFDESQGITDLAVKLFVMAQMRAISSGMDGITVGLIRKVAKEQFHLMKPMLDAIRKGKASALQFEDVTFPSVDSYLAQEQEKMNFKQMFNIVSNVMKGKEEQGNQLKTEAVMRLQFLGLDETKAQIYVDEVMDAGVDGNLGDIVQSAYRRSLSPQEQPLLENKEMEHDLRRLVAQGEKAGQSAYEALREAGVIKQDATRKG